MQYSVICEADIIDDQFGVLSPFNLTKDTKDITDEELNDIAINIANELRMGTRGKTYITMYVCQQDNLINYSKIRCEDSTRKKGKSNGYRCIVLVDGKSHTGFILHIYRHGKGADNITHKEQNALKKLVEQYTKERYN